MSLKITTTTKNHKKIKFQENPCALGLRFRIVFKCTQCIKTLYISYHTACYRNSFLAFFYLLANFFQTEYNIAKQRK